MLPVKETHPIAGPTEFRNQQKIVPRVPPKTLGLAALLGANHSPPTATFSSKSHTTPFLFLVLRQRQQCSGQICIHGMHLKITAALQVILS